MSRVALVTGGGTGIGAAVARRLAVDGYAVAVTGRRPGPIEEVAGEIGGLAVVADVGVAADADRAVAETVASASAGSTPSSLNAGIGGEGSLLDLDPPTFESVFRTNVLGALLVARAAMPQLLERRGSVVTIGSVAGMRAAPESLAYCSSKAALAMLTQCIALDHGPAGVRANCVCPGWVRTPMADEEMDGARARDPGGGVRDGHAGRAATAAELARGDRRRGRLATLLRRLVRQRRRAPGGRRPHDGRRRHARVREGGVKVAGIEVSPDHFIGGERVSSERTFTDYSPIDEQPLGEIARGGQREADLAVAAATEAFPAWAALGAAGRAVYLHRLADLIDANVERLAPVECVDMAMLLRSLKARLINRGARNYRSYADLAVAYEERVWDSNGTHNRVIRMPSGPAVVITPWNAPFMLSTWKTAPALAAGSTMILKPAEWSPLSCSLLADLVAEAGFPPGVFNIVQGIGEEIGAALVSNPGVSRISFTGSPETARHIGVAAAKNIVPFTGELGGKGPLLVFEDCDLEAAARKAAGQFDDAGQVCLAGTRILVQESVAEPFMELFHRFADEHVLGDPRSDDTTVTPLIHREHFDRVAGFVERARANGDEIVRGGHPAERGGLFYEPTLVIPRSNDSEIVQREVFGPVLTVQTFSDEDEGVALANSTPYGLSGIVYTGSAERAERVGRAVRAGTVWVNTFLVRDLTAPFGGIGISGIGREGGDFALDFYSDLKTLQIAEGTTG